VSRRRRDLLGPLQDLLGKDNALLARGIEVEVELDVRHGLDGDPAGTLAVLDADGHLPRLVSHVVEAETDGRARSELDGPEE
jgi:hypothetical protein